MGALHIKVTRTEQREFTRHTFDATSVRIGRNALCDLQLDYGFVSNWHALITIDRDGIHCFDLNSTNGIDHQGREVPRSEGVVAYGQLIVRIGPLELEVHGELDEHDSPAPAPSATADSIPGPWFTPETADDPPAASPSTGKAELRISGFDPTTGREFVHEYPGPWVHIGRDAHNHLSFSPGYVSAWHALVYISGDRAIFFDLNSRNGSYVAGQAISSSQGLYVAHGIEVALGEIRLMVTRPQGAFTADPHPPHGYAEATPSPRGESWPHPAAAPEPAPQVQVQRPSPVEGIMARLAPALRDYEEASARLRDQFETELRRLEPGDQASVTARVRDRVDATGLPSSAGAAQAPAPASAHAPSPSPHGAALGDTALAQLQSELGLSPGPGIDPASFCQRLATLVRTHSQGFATLCGTRDQFREKTKIAAGRSVPQRDESTEQQLNRVLGGMDDQGLRELRASYADLIFHQIALATGVYESAAAMHQFLHPENIEQQAGNRKASPAKLWKSYERMHAAMTRDGTINDVAYGPDFKRSYEEQMRRNQRD